MAATNLTTEDGSESSSGTGTASSGSPWNSPASPSDSVITSGRLKAVPVQLLQKDDAANKIPTESGRSAERASKPVSPLHLAAIKPDPDAEPASSSSEKKKEEALPVVLQQKLSHEEEEEDAERKTENGGGIDIADLADTVVSEEITRKRLHQLQQRIHMAGGGIQVRRDIVEATSSSANGVARPDERGLDLSWAAANGGLAAASPDHRMASDLKEQKQRDLLARAVMQYPGGPPEGCRLYFPSGNAAYDSMNGGRGGQSPAKAGLESVRLGIQVLRHAPRPPPLIR
jgi:hypothetical protein